MEEDKKLTQKPDYVFEVSWEVCNKLGGIYTVVSTKAPIMKDSYDDHFLLIGPDLYTGSVGNAEFLEDVQLFKAWKDQFNRDGLKFRVGRWDIPSKPIVILIDFSPLFDKKDQIFSELWAKNRLDSLKGGWGYIEPALFGYAAGMVIEDFKTFYLHGNDHIIAHFHEWMTSSGVLYLENDVPGVATVFTTHATVTGRALCGGGQPFYSRFETYNGDQVAQDYNTIAKHSLEKTSAVTADAFTTVSDNTAGECQQLLGKAVDKITTNGFDDSYLPSQKEFGEKRKNAKNKLLQVASAVLGYKAQENSFLLATSGRYEYKNKGIDLFLDALAVLNKKEKMARDIIAFVLVPAAHTCPKPEVLDGIETGNLKRGEEPWVLTHYLQDPEHDAIWQQIKNSGLSNEVDQKVKVIYAPIYLDGRDEVFNMPYYDVLIGLDLTVFPSYYEPFGYTPLESLSFHVPTVTTTLTGFGQQVKSKFKDSKEGMLVIERSDFNDQTVIDQITNHISDFSTKDEKELQLARKKAFEISRSYLWKNLIQSYNEVHALALEKYALKEHSLERVFEMVPKTYIEPAQSNEPIWKSAMVKFKMPETLKNLAVLSKNLWWSWHPEASDLFKSIDSKLWEAIDHNPIALLGSLDYQRFLELERDKSFMSRLNSILEEFNTYMARDFKIPSPKIAYLCMEYGLHESIPIYAGGLGILAGDYLKEASDSNADIVAFGLLYRYGYFKQGHTLHGEQVATYQKQHFTQLPITPVLDADGNRLILQLPLRGPMISVQVWKVAVGRIPLYLFDTDIPENGDENKKITHNLYGGDNENRFRQELLLAANTMQLLEILKTQPDIYHYNEGHTAFTSLIRIVKLVIQENLSFEEAGQFVKASTLFTTHTPVPAGQDVFDENLLRSYQSHLADILNVPWDRFLGFGKINPSDRNEKFSMSYLAARLSGEINAVSKIHSEVTRKMFLPMWKGFLEEELQIENVTNGVHYATWTAPLWQQLFEKAFGNGFLTDVSNPEYWIKMKEVPSKQIVDIKKVLKRALIDGIQRRLKNEIKSLHLHPVRIYEKLNSLNENDLIIGFARRFATYKRANLLFNDMDRLSKIVNNPQRPVKFLFAGKAHPMDKGGQDLIKKIIEVSELPEFSGKIFYIQDYDMDLARLMVQGVDVWLNTPQRGNEASGTSGMKATLNGTLNFSVMDGWWAEAYRADAGWALPQERLYEKQSDQDDLDAEALYTLLEHDIIPEYYQLNKAGIQEKWVNRIKNAFIHIAPAYTTARMLKEYQSKYYDSMFKKVQKMRENNYEATKTYVDWARLVNTQWSKISVVDVRVSNGIMPLQLGEKFKAEITLNLGELNPKDIKVELVFAKHLVDGSYQSRYVQELALVSDKNHQAVFKGEATASFTGAFQYDIRFYPKNPLLKYRRNLPLVKWI